jgi:hypothetical protein
MGRTACTEPQCLYSRAIPLLPLWALRPVQSLNTCTRVHFTYLLPHMTMQSCSMIYVRYSAVEDHDASSSQVATVTTARVVPEKITSSVHTGTLQNLEIYQRYIHNAEAARCISVRYPVARRCSITTCPTYLHRTAGCDRPQHIQQYCTYSA